MLVVLVLGKMKLLFDALYLCEVEGKVGYSLKNGRIAGQNRKFHLRLPYCNYFQHSGTENALNSHNIPRRQI